MGFLLLFLDAASFSQSSSTIESCTEFLIPPSYYRGGCASFFSSSSKESLAQDSSISDGSIFRFCCNIEGYSLIIDFFTLLFFEATGDFGVSLKSHLSSSSLIIFSGVFKSTEFQTQFRSIVISLVTNGLAFIFPLFKSGRSA